MKSGGLPDSNELSTGSQPSKRDEEVNLVNSRFTGRGGHTRYLS